MKKYFIFFLCIIFLICNFSVFSYAEQSEEDNSLPSLGLLINPLLPDGYDLCEYLLNRGDINEDGEITASDARLVLRAAANLEPLNDRQKVMADVDVDGEVTASDARDLLRFSASLGNMCAVRVKVTSRYETVTLGPLTGNSDYCWYIKTDLSAFDRTPDINEERIELSETEFEQSFKIYTTGIYNGTLVYGSPDGETVIKEYEFEIDALGVLIDLDEVILG